MVVVTDSYHYNTAPLGQKFYLKFSPACHRTPPYTIVFGLFPPIDLSRYSATRILIDSPSKRVLPHFPHPLLTTLGETEIVPPLSTTVLWETIAPGWLFYPHWPEQQSRWFLSRSPFPEYPMSSVEPLLLQFSYGPRWSSQRMFGIQSPTELVYESPHYTW